ncbi:GIY-YIG nuclease family protein [Nostoc sp.]|uniref:GIY-YIG nuclease family protein n=1 Tax=Nostoc sp. TaxID=1180 RepID=UPI002FF6B6BC
MTPIRAPRAEILVMSRDALVHWKSQILDYQQKVRESKPPLQVTLFDMTPNYYDASQIDPLSLRLVPMSFYRMPVDSPGDACLYFVVDSAAGLILYVGETCRSDKRWKGIHACKDYIASYQDLYYRYEMKTAVNAAFWWDTPTDRRSRQELELSLILKWLSPFNKENWERWGQPFW